MPHDLDAGSANEVTLPCSPPQPQDGPLLGEGVTSFENYEMLERLGAGGMGTVRKARHKRLDRFVAVKTLNIHISKDTRFAVRFQKEARALAALHHPNIVTIHDLGEAADGSLFIVMEYVDGGTLRDRLRNGRLPPAEALRLSREICSALSHAHDVGIVHRDLKPENILVGTDGKACVADFGLAVTHGRADRNASMDSFVGGPVGTIVYMAPEQKVGSGPITPATDIFTLGLIIYEMFAGHVPEGAFDPLSSLGGIPVQMDEIIRCCLQADPMKRFSSATTLKRALATIQTDAAPAPSAKPGSAISRRHLLAGTSALGVVLCVGYGLGWMSQSRRLDLLEGKVEIMATGAKYAAQKAGGAVIEVESKGEIRFKIVTNDHTSSYGGLRVECDSSEQVKGFAFSVTDGETTWKYTHPKPVPKGAWNAVIKGENFTPALGSGSSGPLKEAVLTIEADPETSSPTVMRMQKLALE